MATFCFEYVGLRRRGRRKPKRNKGEERIITKVTGKEKRRLNK
jgi:hypothetical protein